MEYPTNEQISDAVAQSRRLGETSEQLDERVEGMIRWSDADLASIGVTPPPAPPAASAKPTAKPRKPGAKVKRASSDPAHPDPAQPDPTAFTPVPRAPRHDGWTAARQRAFIAALAETGCVSEACAEVGITPRSAYRLREHPAAAAFRTAWDHAQSLAATRLVALAFDRAIHGGIERLYRDGELVAERRRPSDRLLMFLLTHHDPMTYGHLARPQKVEPHPSFYVLPYARSELPGLLDRFADVPPAACFADLLATSDYDFAGDPVPRA